MKTKETDKPVAHFDRCFEQTDCTVLHPEKHRSEKF